jgi:hypothetical protein
MSLHEQTTPEFGRIRARLSTELLLATAEYFRILDSWGLLKGVTSSTDRTEHQCVIEGRPGEQYFFGLDGDDTGRELERLFQNDLSEKAFSNFSQAIEAAMKAVSKKLKQPPIDGTVLFSSGDDILFKGTYDVNAVEELRSTYARLSGGHTCSVGFGKTLKEAYIAMKIAKAAPGKDSVVGIWLVPKDGRPQAAQA